MSRRNECCRSGLGGMGADDVEPLQVGGTHLKFSHDATR